MKLPVIKNLLQNHSVEELLKAADDFEQNQTCSIEVDGKDDGEKLTHLLVAAKLKKEIDKGRPLNEVVREYSQKVRKILS